MSRRLSDEEAIELILSILKKAGKPLSTREIEEETSKLMVSCPDRAPVFLNKLRIKGIIRCAFSGEKKCWLWWIGEKVSSKRLPFQTYSSKAQRNPCN